MALACVRLELIYRIISYCKAPLAEHGGQGTLFAPKATYSYTAPFDRRNPAGSEDRVTCPHRKHILQLNIAEIFYESGKLRYRYVRYLASDGSRWIRHGPFTAFHENGQLASEGNYVDGLENGVWRDFREDGRLAAEGHYKLGQDMGEWQYWDAD